MFQIWHEPEQDSADLCDRIAPIQQNADRPYQKCKYSLKVVYNLCVYNTYYMFLFIFYFLF